MTRGQRHQRQEALRDMRFVKGFTKIKKLVSTILTLIFEPEDRVDRQAQKFVNGFHKTDPSD
jgi:hypothetical protein